MPGEILSDPESEGFAGFFGKLPSTGDFVARGLPDEFRRSWDAWITRHVAPRQRDGSIWPDGGIRFRLRSGLRSAAGVIVPGGDSAGRAFPLTLILIGDQLADPAALDLWCDAALAAAGATADPDDLWDRLDGLDVPARSANPIGEAFVLWTRQNPAISADAADPATALDRVFSSS